MARGALFSKFRMVRGCVCEDLSCKGENKPFRTLKDDVVPACETHRRELKQCQMILTVDWKEHKRSQEDPVFGGFAISGMEIVID